MEPGWPERIARGLRGLAEETPPHGHMEHALAGAQRKMQRGEIVKQRMRRVSLAGAGACALVLALLFVPVSYEMGIGSVVRVDWPEPAGDQNAAAAGAAIAADVKGMDRLVDFQWTRQGERMYLVAAFSDVGQDEAGARIREVILRHADLGMVPDGPTIGAGGKTRVGDIRVATRPIMKLVRADALAAATGGRIQLRVSGASAEEIEQALLAELAAQGFTGSSVDVRTETAGDSVQVQVEVHAGTPPEGAPGDSTQIEMIITHEGR